MIKYYAACGSSETPDDVLALMTRIAQVMADKGFTLRCSEHSKADKAFIAGSKGCFYSYIPCGEIDESLDDPDAVFKGSSPWAIPSDVEPSSGCATFARKLDPKFLMLPRAEKQWEVVANSLVYGLDHTKEARMLICWSQPGDHCERFMKKAADAGIAVYNLANSTQRTKFEKMVERG
jgi:hypothetical protein